MEMVLENGTVVINNSNLRFNTTFRLAALKSGATMKTNSKSIIDITLDNIVFNSKKGIWSVQYHEYGSSRCDDFKINDITVKTPVKNRLKNKDISLFSVLKDFDRQHGTHFSSSYASDNLGNSIVYDNSRLFKNKDYSLKEKLMIFATALKQSRAKNVKVINPRGTGTIAAALIGLTTMIVCTATMAGIGRKANNVKTNQTTKTVVEQQTNEEIVDDTKASVVVDKKTTTKRDKTEVKKEASKVEAKETTKEFKLKSKYRLDDVNLYGSAVGESRSVNTSKINYCDYYKMSLITVIDNNDILELKKVSDLENKKLSEVVADYKKAYGEDVEIYAAFDGYNKETNSVFNIGWSNIKDINVTKSSKNAEKIENLKKLRDSLVSKKDVKKHVKVKK